MGNGTPQTDNSVLVTLLIPVTKDPAKQHEGRQPLGSWFQTVQSMVAWYCELEKSIMTVG